MVSQNIDDVVVVERTKIILLQIWCAPAFLLRHHAAALFNFLKSLGIYGVRLDVEKTEICIDLILDKVSNERRPTLIMI